MKSASVISLIIVAGLTSCDTMNQTVSSGDFDPLRTPGGGVGVNLASRSPFSGGQLVTAAMDNTAFFKSRPKGEAEASKLLNKGTSMKVISTSENYVKVELDGTGEVGWVTAVQLEDPKKANGVPTGNPGEYQIYPPPGGVEPPLPIVDPSAQPPDGAIPTVIDPDAPAAKAKTAAGEVAPKKQPAPLPPNGEEGNQ